MITKTQFCVDISLIESALQCLPSKDFKFTINKPTGDFFYDPWEIKNELKGSVWEQLYNSLPLQLGQTRIICLEGRQQYMSHADIDDRYHLNLSGESCYLTDLDNDKLYKTKKDGTWYEMDAGIRHSAVNFSPRYRYQLVARKLLNKTILKNKKNIIIKYHDTDLEDARYYFDNSISQWLNRANKRLVLNNFNYCESSVSFETEETEIESLISLCNKKFILEIK